LLGTDASKAAIAAGPSLIRRRHVFYVEGYDPRGAEGYHRLFARELSRFVATWGVEASVSELAIDSEDIAHWNVETKGANWQTSTRYEFVRFEHVIRAAARQPLVRQVPRTLHWIIDDLASGTLFRIFRASSRFVVHLIVLQAPLLAWLLVSIAAGWVAAVAIERMIGAPWPVALLSAVVVWVALFAALRPLTDRSLVMQVANGWPLMRDFARGRPTGHDRPIEVFAAKLVAAARSGEADEILIVGHSAGGLTAPIVVARALELDPDLGRRGPRVTLITVGSLLPAFALHPAAERMRAAIGRLAVEPAVRWVDCQARKDSMNFWDFDPVGGVGIEVGAARKNPIIWPVRLRDMLTDAAYDRLRHAHFRMHYQYVMANDRPAPYDYFLLVCGPVPVTEWAVQPDAMVKSFGARAAYERLGARVGFG
jgi:hypothetical protein